MRKDPKKLDDMDLQLTTISYDNMHLAFNLSKEYKWWATFIPNPTDEWEVVKFELSGGRYDKY